MKSTEAGPCRSIHRSGYERLTREPGHDGQPNVRRAAPRELVDLHELFVGGEGTTIPLTLQAGENVLEVYAVNEGSAPPNTALLEVSHVVEGLSAHEWRLQTGEFGRLTITAPLLLPLWKASHNGKTHLAISPAIAAAKYGRRVVPGSGGGSTWPPTVIVGMNSTTVLTALELVSGWSEPAGEAQSASSRLNSRRKRSNRSW